jgi:hypothetical protein
MNKKGLSETEWAILILAAVILIALLSIIPNFSKSANRKIDEDVCTQSIAFHSGIKDFSEGFAETGINCPVVSEEIDAQSYEEVYDTIAQDLKRCWSKTLGRKNRLWKSDWLSFDDDICIVCSSFSVKKNKYITENINTLEIADHLNRNDPQSKLPYTQILDTDWYGNYNRQYFVDAKYGDGSDDVEVGPLETIRLSDKEDEYDYLTVFLAFSDKGWFGNAIDFESGTWDVQYTKIEGDTDVTFHTFVIPELDVYNLRCEYIFWQEDG